MPKVSVIIPNYNHSEFLKQRVESVLNQTYRDFELIILDDFSEDNSSVIIESYRSNPIVSHILYNNINCGSPFIQWAKGIQLARGEYIWIAESDDWAECSFLEELMLYAQKFPDVGFLYTDTIVVFELERYLMGPPEKELYRYFYKGQLLKERLLNGIQICNGSAVIFKRGVALDYLIELTQYQKHGDYFLWTKISEKCEAVFLNKPLNYFRVLETSVTRKSINSTTSIREYLTVFNLLSSRLSLLNKPEVLRFYECWALKFSILLKNSNSSFFYFSRKANVKRLNISCIYFWIRFSYHLSRQYLSRL